VGASSIKPGLLENRFRVTERCDHRDSDEQLLPVAKENLTESFSVVGICERFEESLILISKTFGWEVQFYENQRLSQRRSLVEPQLADLIREHNHLDNEIHEFGEKLFEQALRKSEDG
jgi:hypothetical protein